MEKTLEQWEYELHIKNLYVASTLLYESYEDFVEETAVGVHRGEYIEFNEYIKEALDSIDEAYAILRTIKPEELEAE